MMLKIYTSIHIVISLVAVVSGIVVLFGMLDGKRLEGRTKFFLITTVSTSVTGFFFPFHGFTPALGTGIISLVVAILARYVCHLAGAWSKTYVISAVISLYLNVFVLVVQAFLKIPALKEIAPTQNDPPLKFTQIIVLTAFVVLGILAALKFRSEVPAGAIASTRTARR